jgi:hypothetical protein
MNAADKTLTDMIAASKVLDTDNKALDTAKQAQNDAYLAWRLSLEARLKKSS